jgi:sugar phosphate isomerase/epimerase
VAEPGLGFGDLVLCAGTLPGAGLEERAAAAAEAGFAGISLFAADYARARAAGRSDADLRALLRDQGLAVAELDALLRWVPWATASPSSTPSPTPWARARSTRWS